MKWGGSGKGGAAQHLVACPRAACFSVTSLLTMLVMNGIMIFIMIQAGSIAAALTGGQGASGPGEVVQRATMSAFGKRQPKTKK
jgi:hypothetical protein